VNTWRALVALVWLGVLAGCATIHRPQRPHRTGLWGEFAGGGGQLRMSCSTCTDPINAPGATGLTRIGGTLSDRVLLGGESAIFIDEAFGFSAGDSTTVAQLETVGVVVLWFPWRSGVFFKGGVGIAEGLFTIDNGTARPDSTEGVGIGMTFGFGLDVPISRKFAFTANAASFVTAIGDIVLPSRRVDDVIGSMFQFSVGVTWR
jgi:hypothetical protein